MSKKLKPTVRDLETYKSILESVKELFRLRSHSSPNLERVKQLIDGITAKLESESQNPYLSNPPNAQNRLKVVFELLANPSQVDDVLSAVQPHLRVAMNIYETAKRDSSRGAITERIVNFFGG